MTKRIQSGWPRPPGVRRLIGFCPVALAGLGILFAPPVSAETNIVSRPAGLVRVVLPTNSEALVSTPFLPFNPDINALFADQLTGATNEDLADAIRQWNPLLRAYTNAYNLHSAVRGLRFALIIAVATNSYATRCRLSRQCLGRRFGRRVGRCRGGNDVDARNGIDFLVHSIRASS